MYYYICGELALTELNVAVIDCGGVGYKLTISGSTQGAVAGKIGQKVKLFTHLAVREDDMELFGFWDEQELETFKLLTGVSGVGPKAAMAILSCFTPEKFALAVCTEDKKSIAKANGIGPKTAARIILELKDKMMAQDSLPTFGDAPVSASSVSSAVLSGGNMSEAQEALLVLGYNRTEILSVLHTIDTSTMGTEDIIRAALKKLMR